jgi:competence CoiA-like predicted nuclease
MEPEIKIGQYYESKVGKTVIKVTKIEDAVKGYSKTIIVEIVMKKNKLITEADDEYGGKITSEYVLKEDYNLIPELKSNLIYKEDPKKT